MARIGLFYSISIIKRKVKPTEQSNHEWQPVKEKGNFNFQIVETTSLSFSRNHCNSQLIEEKKLWRAIFVLDSQETWSSEEQFIVE